MYYPKKLCGGKKQKTYRNVCYGFTGALVGFGATSGKDISTAQKKRKSTLDYTLHGIF